MNNNRNRIISSITAAVVSMSLGIMVMAGWFTHSNSLISLVPGMVTMKFNAAIGLVFSSAVLLLCAFPGRNRFRYLVCVSLSVIVSLIGLLTFAEYFFGSDIGIDELFIKDSISVTATYYTGRMSPLSAVNFVLIGIGLLLLNKEETANYQFFYLSGIAFISLIMLIGFNFIADIPTFINLSIYEVVGFLALCASIYFAQPMLRKKISFDRKLFTNFSAIIILIAVLSIFSSYYNSKRISTSQSVKQTIDVLNELDQISFLVKNCAGDASGYIITGDSNYLHHFTIAKNNITAHNKKLAALTKDNPSQQARIASLSVLVYKQLSFSSQCIQAKNEKGFSAAQELMVTGQGKVYSDSIGKVSLEIQLEENHLLIQRQIENTKSIKSFNRAFFVLLASIFSLLIIIFFSMRRNIAILKKAGEQIRESEHMFSTLFYKSPVLKAIIEESTGNYIEVNDAFVDFSGNSKKDFMGKPFRKMNMLGDPGNIDEIMKNIRENGFVRELEMQINCKDGRASWVSTNIDIANLNGKDCLLTTAIDITKRKIAEDNLLTLTQELEEIVRERTQELNRSEKSYRYLFENNPMPMWVIDLNTFKFLDVNEMAILQYGYSREEFFSMTTLDIRPDEEKERFKQPGHLSEMNAINYIKGVWNHKKKDGTIIQAEVIAHKIIFEGIAARIVLSNDVTEKKKAEDKLDRSEKRFRALVENNEGIIALLDKNFNTIYCSPSSERITGWTSAEKNIIGSHQQIHPDDDGYLGNILTKVLENPDMTFDITFRTRHKHGHYIWLEGVFTNMIYDPNVGAIITNLRDITARKEAEEKLIASEKQFRDTLDSMLEGAQIIGFDWRYKYVNDSMARHGKYSKKELLGYTVMEKYPGIEHSDIFSAYQRCFDERVSIHQENEFEFPDNTKGWFEFSFQPVSEGIFILSIDITDRKKAEFEIQKLNQELEQKVADRTDQLEIANKELEAFSYSVSHDLRAPLRAINGFSIKLAENYSAVLDNEGQRLFSRIKENAKKMGLLIDDLLEFSRLGRKEIHKSPIEMTELVEASLLEINATIKHEAAVKIHHLHCADADSTMITQVMINLLSNAIKYSSKTENPSIEITSHLEENEIIYSVSDNGVGFNNQFVHKLFGVFQRLHLQADFEGTGVGLALVKRIINKHGGRVWATGELNKGATFFFSLPATINN